MNNNKIMLTIEGIFVERLIVLCPLNDVNSVVFFARRFHCTQLYV